MTDREWDRVLREWATSEDPRRGEGCRGAGQPTEVVRDPGWYVAGEVETIDKIDEDDYGFCDACGVEIGIRRLEARPTATLCVDCKTLAELKEKQLGG